MLSNGAYEPVIDADLPIIDAHHHIWAKPPPYGGRAERRYLFDDLRADVASGHNVIATVHIECHNAYRAEGPELLRSVGETEFLVAESARLGQPGLCAGIIAHADLILGDAVTPLLEAHIAAGSGRVKGIRQYLVRNDDPALARLPKRPAGMTYSVPFREGFARLSPLGLVFEALVFHPQLKELRDLAGAFPDITIIVPHAGTAIGIGGYAHKKAEVQKELRAELIELAACPNVYIKLGGLGMFIGGSPLLDREPEASMEKIAAEWNAIIHFCIEQFGVHRCMFESNFPVDNATCSYRRLWNVFKYITKDYTADERQELFAGTAAKVYKLPMPSSNQSTSNP
jgi:L-fuconolactonase